MVGGSMNLDLWVICMFAEDFGGKKKQNCSWLELE
jgi:hypothetical protein